MKHFISADGKAHTIFTLPTAESGGEPMEENGSDVIERLEHEMGCRVDSNGGQNDVTASLMGMMSRALGQSNHQPKDDVIAGTVIQLGHLARK